MPNQTRAWCGYRSRSARVSEPTSAVGSWRQRFVETSQLFTIAVQLKRVRLAKGPNALRKFLNASACAPPILCDSSRTYCT